jgi:hypothetical protein
MIDPRCDGDEAGQGRQRRALEGWLVGRIRTQARERRAKRGRPPSDSRVRDDSSTRRGDPIGPCRTRFL